MARSQRNRRLPNWLIGLSLMTCLPGCFLLPVYHQPQGFSSTYYRHLQETAQAQAALTSTPLPTTPEPAETSQANDEPQSTGTWSWIRNPLATDRSADAKAESSARH